ncbi:MAG: T9SS type A sorting domain-containing protein [Bacteroidota bacterium]
MKNTYTLLMGWMMLCSLQAYAQERYLSELFSEDSIIADVYYATNYSILSNQNILLDQPVLDSLHADIYMPKGDTSTARHIVLIAHGGYFLPPIVNGSPNGGKRDSSVVEICRRLARMGYVAVSYEYRLGWNPVSPNRTIRDKTALEALYRASQDTHALVRFLRKSVFEMGNPWSLNPTKIAVGGVEMGGYIALFNGLMDDFQKMIQNKFVDFDSIPSKHYLDTLVIGNIWGTGPQSASANVINHPGYDSDINFLFTIGGFLLDTTWIEENGKPIVSFQTKPRRSCVITPMIDPVILSECQSFDSKSIIQTSRRKGNQQILEDGTFNDVFTQSANNNNEGNEGLFLFVRPALEPGERYDCRTPCVPLLPATEELSPWDWWNEEDFIATWDAATGGDPVPGAVANCSQLASNPDMSPEKGRMYVDSIIGYLAPRMNVVLQATNTGGTTSIDNSIKETINFGAYPNPANESLFVRSSEIIRSVVIYDLAGREVRRINGLRATKTEIARENIEAGLYIIQADFDNTSVTQKVMWQ